MPSQSDQRAAAPAAEPPARERLLTRALSARVACFVALVAAGAALAQWLVGGTHGVPWVAAVCAAAGAALGIVTHRRWMARYVAAPFAELAERLRAEQAQRA